MDKRTVLAFALMFLVLIGWNVIFAPKPSDDAAPAPPETAESTPPRGAPLEGPPSTATSPGVTEEEAVSPPTWRETEAELGETVQVETDLFSAEFDRVGADIVSWKLKKFTTTDGTPVELVPDRSLDGSTQRAHALSLLFDDRAVDLRNVEFTSSRSELRLHPGEPQGELRLQAAAGDGSKVEIELRFDNDRYGFDAELRFDGGTAESSPAAIDIAWPGGIARSEPDSSREYAEFKAVAQVGADIHKKRFKDLRGDGSKGRARYEGMVSWAGATSQYFVSLVLSAGPRPGTVRLDGNHERALQTFEAELSMEREARSTVAYGVYMGPLDVDALAVYKGEPYSTDVTELVEMGPALFRPVARVTLAAIKLLHAVLPNYGLVIIVFSAFTKLLFYPLTKSSTQSMKKMQEIQPLLTKLREKYKDDQQRQSQEMMALYKKHGINPMGGCLPLVVQMPVFWALFTILRKTIELRQAEFIWWMDDLSQPDVLFELPFSLPILGNHFCVLPFLMAGSMWWQSKISSPGSSGGGGGAMGQQMKMMGTLMPIMMFVFFYNSPSGLVLYWFVNTILTAAQTWRIHKKMQPSVDLTPQAELA